MLVLTRNGFFSGAYAVLTSLYAGASTRHTLDAALALAAFAVIGMVTICLVVLLHPAARAAKLLASSLPARSPQARSDRDLFVDAAPFASALDASLRSAAALFIDARFMSMWLTLTLVA
eukprot:6172215-Pleurochrysis_carterae.AAC.1